MRPGSDNAILNLLYRGTTTIQDFCWDNLRTVPILYLMSVEDIEYIRKLILSARYSGNNKLKREKIDEVMHRRGFSRFAGGTNRIVYIHPDAPNTVFKVAIDSVGISDNPAEFRNQQFLKPYCCKVFECSPCGTIASFERVERITTMEEYYTIADDYFYILSRVILGKYIMEDIGTNFFMNVGIRFGSHPVLLDFPYLFELDGAKLECLNTLDDGSTCGGEIDYDDGFNNLVCKKCGRIYRARDLVKEPKSKGILLRQKGARKMKITITKGDTVIKSCDTTEEREYLSKTEAKRNLSGDRTPKVELVKSTKVVEKKPVEVETVVRKSVTVTARPNVKKEEPKKVVKTVVKRIPIVINKDSEASPEKKETTVQISLKKRTVKVQQQKPIQKKESVSTNPKPVPAPAEKPANSDAPILKRVVDVSIGKKPDTIIKAEDTATPSSVVINVSRTEKEAVVKKADPIVKINTGKPIVTDKKEVEPKVVIKRLNINVNGAEEKEIIKPEEDPKVEVKVEKPVIEEKVAEPEPVVEEVKAEEPAIKVIKEAEPLIPEEPKVMCEAITFLDEVPAEEPAVVEPEVESEPEEAQEEAAVEEIPAEEPTVEEPAADNSLDAAIVEAVKEVTYQAAAEEVTSEEPTVEEPTNDDDDEGEYAIEFVTTIPAEPEEDVFYCVPKNDSIDITAYDGIKDPTLIDESLFEIYMYVDQEIVRLTYDNDEWMVYYNYDTPNEPLPTAPETSVPTSEEAEEDALIASLGKVGKQSLADLVD